MSPLISVDPFSWIDQLRKTTKLFEWITLIFQMGFSATVTFLSVTGTALMSHASTGVAIGSGMSSTAVVLAVFFGRSSLTRGMLLVRPMSEAKAELESDLAITERNPNLPK